MIPMSSIIFAKLDPGFFDNPKVIRAGRNGRDVFLFALLVNANRGATGCVPVHEFEPWCLARRLGISEVEAAEGLERAITAKLLKPIDHCFEIVGWDSDWSRRPLTRAEIQKNYRERSKDGEDRYQSKVTRYQANNALPIDQRDQREENRGNAVTEPSAPGSLSRDSETRSGSEGKARPSRMGRGPRVEVQSLPDDWKPKPEAVELARSLGLDVAHELAQFLDDSRAKGRTCRDWDAAFRKWCRGSRDAGKAKAKPKPGATTTRPARMRVRTEDGRVLEEDEYGEFMPVSGENP